MKEKNKGGAPKGNTNSATGKEGRRALELALEHYDPNEEKPFEGLQVIGRVKTLILMWEPIIRKALTDGDLHAMKEINDRLDGRAAQSIDISANVDLGIQDMSDSDLNRKLKQLEQANEQSAKD